MAGKEEYGKTCHSDLSDNTATRGGCAGAGGERPAGHRTECRVVAAGPASRRMPDDARVPAAGGGPWAGSGSALGHTTHDVPSHPLHRTERRLPFGGERKY